MNKEVLLQKLKQKEKARHTLKYIFSAISLIQLTFMILFDEVFSPQLTADTVLNHKTINSYIDLQLSLITFMIVFLFMIAQSAILWLGSYETKAIILLLEEDSSLTPLAESRLPNPACQIPSEANA